MLRARYLNDTECRIVRRQLAPRDFLCSGVVIVQVEPVENFLTLELTVENLHLEVQQLIVRFVFHRTFFRIHDADVIPACRNGFW